MLRIPVTYTVLSLLWAAARISAADAAEETSDQLIPLRTHSIFAPYVDQDLQNRWFDFGGEAFINTNKHVRLTQDRQSETGWLWSRLPITVSSFQIEVEFRISGTGAHLNGDGMAIWLTKERQEYGSVFGNADQFTGLGLFLDTYANGRHSYTFPRVVGMMGDGHAKYNHDDDGDSNAAGACSAGIRRSDIKTVARITYKKEVGISVFLQYKGWDEWTHCFTIANATLPSSPYLGVTAITGELHDAHDIISISSHTIFVRASAPVGDSNRGNKTGSSSGDEELRGNWLGFILKVSLLGGVCAAAYQGYKVYYVQNGRWSNKRF